MAYWKGITMFCVARILSAQSGEVNMYRLFVLLNLVFGALTLNIQQPDCTKKDHQDGDLDNDGIKRVHFWAVYVRRLRETQRCSTSDKIQKPLKRITSHPLLFFVVVTRSLVTARHGNLRFKPQRFSYSVLWSTRTLPANPHSNTSHSIFDRL